MMLLDVQFPVAVQERGSLHEMYTDVDVCKYTFVYVRLYEDTCIHVVLIGFAYAAPYTNHHTCMYTHIYTHIHTCL